MILAHRSANPGPAHPEEAEQQETAFRLFEEQLRNDGQLIATQHFHSETDRQFFIQTETGLQPSSSDDSPDPFAVYLVEVKDFDEAKAVAGRCPADEGARIEVVRAASVPAELR